MTSQPFLGLHTRLAPVMRSRQLAAAGVDLGAVAADALDELSTDVDRLSVRCHLTLGANPRAACLNIVGEARDFLSGPAARLLVKVRDGDLHAAENLARATTNIRAAVVDGAAFAQAELSVGALFSRFISEVAQQTGSDLSDVVRTTGRPVAGVLLVVAGGYVVVRILNLFR